MAVLDETHRLIEKSRAELKEYASGLFGARSQVSFTRVRIDQSRELAKAIDADLAFTPWLLTLRSTGSGALPKAVLQQDREIGRLI